MTPSCHPARKAPNAYHHGDLRKALIEAALAELERGGPEAISLTAIAKKLGVSQPAPYRHFTDREALLAAVATEGFRAFIAALNDSVALPSPQPALSRMAKAYVAFGLGHHGLYRLMFASRTVPSAVGDSELQAVAQESFGLLLAALGPQTVAYRERRALKIWSALHGVVMLAEQGLLPGKLTDLTLDALVEDIVAP